MESIYKYLEKSGKKPFMHLEWLEDGDSDPQGVMKRAIRILRTMVECNYALLRATDERELMKDICRIIVEEGGYRFCWVGYAESGKGRIVRPAAWAGKSRDYLDSITVTWDETRLGRGPTGVAIRTGKASVVRDISRDSRYLPWRDEALKRGFASSLALPLNDAGRHGKRRNSCGANQRIDLPMGYYI